MSKTRRNKTGTKGRGTYLRGWSQQQPSTHQRTCNVKKLWKKNVFLDRIKVFQFVQKTHVK